MTAVVLGLFCFGCLVLAVLFWFSFSGCPLLCILTWLPDPSGPVLIFLSCQSCPGSRVLKVLSWQFKSACSVLSVPFWLSRSGGPDLAVLFYSSCSGCPFLAVLSFLFCSGSLSQQSCAGSPIPAALSWQSCPGSPVLAALSRQLFPGSPVLAILSWKYHIGSLVLPVIFCLSRSNRPILQSSCCCSFLTVFVWLSSLSILPLLSCRGSSFLAALTRQSCLDGPVLKVLPWQSLPGIMVFLSYSACWFLPFMSACHVLPVPFWLSFSAVLYCLPDSAYPILPVLICLSCSFYPVLDVPFWMFCSSCPLLPVLFSACPFLLILFFLSCSACPVLPVLFCSSHSACPVLDVLFCHFLPVLFCLLCAGCLLLVCIYRRTSAKGNCGRKSTERVQKTRSAKVWELKTRSVGGRKFNVQRAKFTVQKESDSAGGGGFPMGVRKYKEIEKISALQTLHWVSTWDGSCCKLSSGVRQRKDLGSTKGKRRYSIVDTCLHPWSTVRPEMLRHAL